MRPPLLPLTGAGWPYKCNWNRCKYRFCKGLSLERRPLPTREQFKTSIAKFRVVFENRIGCVL